MSVRYIDKNPLMCGCSLDGPCHIARYYWMCGNKQYRLYMHLLYSYQRTMKFAHKEALKSLLGKMR